MTINEKTLEDELNITETAVLSTFGKVKLWYNGLPVSARVTVIVAGAFLILVGVVKLLYY